MTGILKTRRTSGRDMVFDVLLAGGLTFFGLVLSVMQARVLGLLSVGMLAPLV